MQSTWTMTWCRSPKLSGPSNQAFLKSFQHQKSVRAKIATEYEVHPTQLKNWRAVALEGLPALFEKQDNTVALQAAHEQQLTELYAEIGKLTTQVTWLKKKLQV